MLNTQNFIRLLNSRNENKDLKGSFNRISFIKKHKKQFLAQFIKSNVLKYSDKPHIISYFEDLLIVEKESYFDSSFLLSVDPELEDKVNDCIRDLEISKLIDMNKVYFDLPIDIICDTVAIIDRFIARVKVKPKYMPSVVAVSLQIAAAQKGNFKQYLQSESLVSLMRCGASAADMERLRQIVQSKLCDCMPRASLTDFIWSASHVLLHTDDEHQVTTIDPALVRIIEQALCHLRISLHKPSHLALACLMLHGTELHRFYLEIQFAYMKSMQMDMDLVRRLSADIAALLPNPQEQEVQLHEQSEKSSVLELRRQLIWVISRKTLIKSHPSAPPQLITIAEGISEDQ